MKRYRRKTPEVWAQQWDGSPLGAVLLMHEAHALLPLTQPTYENGLIRFESKREWYVMQPGDWLVRKGDQPWFFVDPPHVFEKNYEEISETS